MSVVVAASMSGEWFWMTDFIANLRYRLKICSVVRQSRLNVQVQLILVFILTPPAQYVCTQFIALHLVTDIRNIPRQLRK